MVVSSRLSKSADWKEMIIMGWEKQIIYSYNLIYKIIRFMSMVYDP